MLMLRRCGSEMSRRPSGRARRRRHLCSGIALAALAIPSSIWTGAAAAQQAGSDVALDTVVVQGEAPRGDLPPAFAGGQVARGGNLGLLGTTDVFNAPFSLITYTSEVIRDRQAATAADALILDPSVRVTSPGGGMVDSYYIRGLPLNEGTAGEVAFAGVYGVAPSFRIFNDYVERIEVLKGPGALLYGMSPNGGVGGVINIVPKIAREDLTRLSTGYVSDGNVSGHADIARRYGEGREFGVRFSGGLGAGDTVFENQAERMQVGALALDYQGTRYRTWLYLLAQNENITAPVRPFQMASGVAVPTAPNGRNNVTQSWEWSQTDDRSVLWRNEYDLTDNWMVFANVGAANSGAERFFGLPTITNAAGDTRSAVQYYNLDVDRYTYDLGSRAKFDTGFVHHTVSLEGSYYDETQNRAFPASPGTVFSNIYNPIARAPIAYFPTAMLRLSDSTLSGISLADTLSVLDDRIQLTLGARLQNVQSNNYSTTTGARATSYDESAVSPMAGLVVRPLQNLTFYANYIEGLSKGDVAPVTAVNSGEVFAPYQSKQVEIGVKAEIGKLVTTLAVFQITKPGAELSSASLYSLSGEQRIRGIEWETFGEVMPGVRILGGVTLMQGMLTQTAVLANVGNTPIGVPSVQANISAEWDLPWVTGLTATGALIYTGKQYINTANTQWLPDWTRVDLGLRYVTTINQHRTTFRASVQNVADTAYWSGVASFGTFAVGAPRTVLLSMDVDF